MCVCPTQTHTTYKLILAENKHQVNIDRCTYIYIYIEPSNRSTLAIPVWKLLRKYLPFDRKVIS